MKKLTPEQVIELANEHSVKAFITDQQQQIHDLKRERDDAVVRLVHFKKALWEIHDKVQEALKLK